MFSDTESNAGDAVKSPYTAPILADDEVAKDPSGLAHQPAVEPPAFDLEAPSSRPSSRPASLYKETSFELRSTPLEDVKEYEPLFKDDEKPEEKKPATEEKRKNSHPHRFPSADVWEDAPSSVFYTTEVSTPELFDDHEKPSPSVVPREGETPAQAFARHHEELAEKEARGERVTEKPLWAQHQKHLLAEKAAARPNMQHRFPSRDVWEDSPESLQLVTTVSTPQQDDAPSPSPADTLKPEIPDRPQPKPSEPAATEKPAIPERPKPRQASVDDNNNKPAVPDRPKPQIPARPAKAGPTSGGLEPAEAAAPPPRQKPAVPARPMGSKIAALQAGFMNDLNRRLQLGPQVPPKKDEPGEGEKGEGEDEKEREKEKVPLVDARKGRARGPARRAPAAAAAVSASGVDAAPKAEEGKKEAVVLGFVGAVTFFEIDPDEGRVSAGAVGKGQGEVEAEPEAKVEAQVEGKKTEEVEVEAEEAAVEAAAPAPAEGKEEKVDAVVAAGPELEEASGTAEAKAEPEPEPQAEGKAEPEAEAEPEPEAEKQETKSLATNMAGETLVAEEVKKDQEHEVVEPVKVVEH
jgi:hypothetical protein